MRCLVALLSVFSTVYSLCVLNEWSLPVQDQDPSFVFNVPVVIPLFISDGNTKDFYPPGVQLAEAVLYTVSYINREVLNHTGFCLNTTIIDNNLSAPRSVSQGMVQLGKLSSGHQGFCSSVLESGPVVGFLGAAKSDNTIALANLCNVLQLPQISYASTSLDLDDSEAYPFFLRTVPSDQLQAMAIVEIIRKSDNWQYIGIIASDNNYGGAGLSAFLTHASTINNNGSNEFCIAFQYKLENPQSVAIQVLEHIKQTQLTVVVLFSDLPVTDTYFAALQEQLKLLNSPELEEKVRRITYIGSDSWASNNQTFTDFYGKIFHQFIGVGVYTKEIEGFRAHLAQLNTTHYNSIYDRLEENYFIQWYELIKNKKIDWKSHVTNIKLDDHSSTTADATHAFGQGLLEYIQSYNITSSLDTVTADLFRVLKDISFTSIAGNDVSFGEGNQQVGRYYIVQYSEGEFQHRGNYSYGTLYYDNPYRNTSSICSARCGPGLRKKSTSPCCHQCIACGDHEYSTGDTSECYPCNPTYTHNADHTKCVPVTPHYITYSSHFAIILYILILAGFVMVGFITGVFVMKFQTPVVQGHGVFIYITLLSSCVVLLASSILFLGEPSDLICNLQLAVPILGVSCLFLCVCCLTKTVILKLRALQFSKFYVIQLAILATGIVIQIVIIGLVLYLKPRVYNRREITRGAVYVECKFKEGTPSVDMIMYFSTVIISATSLILSFLGRNINENYNEGKFLVFQTIAMHIVIVAFIPTILLLDGPTLSGAWAVTIIIMCFIVLIVLFTPKLYIIIYRPYKNQFIDELLSGTGERTNGVINEENCDN